MIYWLSRFVGICALIGIICIPSTMLFAQGYVQLVGVPGVPNGGNGMTTGQYVNALYTISIGVAALLAVVRIIFAGAKYILSDIVTDKGDAKKDIRNAIIGLLVVLSAVLLLQTINRQLVNFDILSTLEPVTVEIEAPQRTECQINDKSAACCRERDGTYIVTAGGESTCTNEDAGVPITGDDLDDQLRCEGAGFNWDSSLTPPCRERAARYEDLPSRDLEGYDLDNLSAEDQEWLDIQCSLAYSAPSYTWTFSAERRQCVGL